MAAIRLHKIVTSKNIVILLLCMCAVSAFLGGPIFYGLLVIYSLYNVLITKGERSHHIFTVFFLIIVLASTLINLNQTEVIFKPEQRVIMLVFVLIAFSPIITNRYIYRYRKYIFISLLVGMSITSLISSIMGLMGKGYIDKYLVGWYDFPNSLGYAQGLTIIALSSITTIVPQKVKYLCIIGILITIIAIPKTGTRTAFYSIPIVLLGYIYLKSTNTTHLLKLLFLLIISTFIFLTFVKLDTSIINKKNELQELQGSSRDALWKARIKEFKQSPIIGIGTFRADLRYSIVNKNGNVEAGNSFLMMLSMNGLLGFINFCLLYLSILIPFFKYIIKKRKYGLSHFEVMLSLVIIYNFISMQQMGLLLNIGLYFTGINWLTLALAYKFRQFNFRKNRYNGKIVLHR